MDHRPPPTENVSFLMQFGLRREAAFVSSPICTCYIISDYLITSSVGGIFITLTVITLLDYRL